LKAVGDFRLIAEAGGFRAAGACARAGT